MLHDDSCLLGSRVEKEVKNDAELFLLRFELTERFSHVVLQDTGSSESYPFHLVAAE